MSNYIYCVLGKMQPNCYIVTLKVTLPLHSNTTFVAPAKIDTGCASTAFSYKALVSSGVSMNKLPDSIRTVIETEARNCKVQAINAGLIAKSSGGVNDSVEFTKQQNDLFRNKRYLDCTTASFIHNLDDGLILSGYHVPVESVKINYDRPRSILIGMDILKDFDRHEGISKVTGEPIMLACHKDNINPDYLEALRLHLGYIPEECLYSKVLISSLRATFMKKFTSIIKPSKPEDLF